ncbi:MAG TPA: methionyl-tRNA formyltransferase [Candidatus Acidoferrales bacterium]|nr:methionyl-tRNA formyltransferase [Candidatus Acidoferrales bacterium]
MALRILFCGTPEFAVPSLRALLAAPDISIEAVITQPDRPRGRGQETASPPVKDVALVAGLHVFQPEKIKSESAQEFIAKIKPDAIVIIAYGQIIPAGLLEIPRLGWINVHASLLPKYRGAAPIQWAIINGETRTGVTTMRIDAGLDTGPMLERTEIEIGTDETAPELSRRLADVGASLIVSTLGKLERGEFVPRAQDNSQASLARPLKKEDGATDWSLTAAQIYNRIRGLEPWPGVYTTFRGHVMQFWGTPALIGERGEPGLIRASHGEVLVACGGGTWLALSEVKLEGRKRMAARDFANGARLMPDEKVGDSQR